MINVKYTAAITDSSGYGSAARSYVACLLATKEVDVTVEVVSFENQKTTHGQVGELIRPLIGKKLDHKIQIVHLTPENFSLFLKKDQYNIGYCVWETDKLPDKWADHCNQMNEIWVPSDYNIKAFKKSGVNRPIYKILHGIETPDLTGITPMSIGTEDTFVFYSIGQWIERKNFRGLLIAYLTEFNTGEKVTLALKSYRLNTSPEEQKHIVQTVQAIKKGLNLPAYPSIDFFGSLFTREQIKSLHMRGNCFILPVRSEGFGITQAEAMIYGKPVITSRYGGALEFANDNNSFLVNCIETPVCGMLFGNYNGSMTWAEPNIMEIRKHMRYVFEHQEEAKRVGLQAQKDIQKQLNWNTIGQSMLVRLKEIESSLGSK